MKAIGVTGHQAIPDEAQHFIQRAIEAALARVQGPMLGVSSLAAGADQLFARLVVDHGGKLKVIVPCEGYEGVFINDASRTEYLRLLMLANEQVTLPFAKPSEQAFFAAGKRVVESSDFLIAVWDGRPAKGRGGTADIVAYARETGKEVLIAWPQSMER